MGPLPGVLAQALAAWCRRPLALAMVDSSPWPIPVTAAAYDEHPVAADADALVASLFFEHGRALVRLASLFVDDRNAAEDLVQEAFIRLARNVGRIEQLDRAPAYLRSIVLNLARDENRRGLVSLRHRLPLVDDLAGVDDALLLEEEQRRVLAALRRLPARQRTCLVLRYYDELGPDDIAATMGISRNSVKTHLKRGLAALEGLLGPTPNGNVP